MSNQSKANLLGHLQGIRGEDTVSAFLDAEFELMVARCAEKGVSREKVQGHIGLLHFKESLNASIAAEEAKAEAQKTDPVRLLLQRAFDAEIDGQRELHSALCLQWLEAKYGLVPGDTAEVHGWAVPRHILLSGFQVSWSGKDHVDDGFLWFEGKWVNGGPRNINRTSHGAPMDSGVYKRGNGRSK